MKTFHKKPASITRADRIRERELFRYYQPCERRDAGRSQEGVGATAVLAAYQGSSPDTTLTALAQLVAIRTDVKSVLINVITKDTQYTLSEGTKTINLANTHVSENPEDALWIGCSSHSKVDSLCERTIALPSTQGGSFPFYTISDLSKDEKYQKFAFVKEHPKWRYYSGCPLTTRKGINIGALCLLDDKPRAVLTADQREFMTTISRTIMRHLEMNREAEERKKGTRMSKGLNAFVEGKTWLTPEELYTDEVLPSTQEWDRKRPPHRMGRSSSSSHNAPSGLSNPLQPSLDDSNVTTPSQDEAEVERVHTDIDIQRRLTFSRAANLLRLSLDLQGGGVVFYDTAIGFSEGDPENFTESVSLGENGGPDDARSGSSLSTEPTLNGSRTATFDSFLKPENNQKKAAVQGKCTALPFQGHADSTKMPSFEPIGETALAELIKKYPRGKLWSFDEDGFISSSDDEEATESSQKSSGKTFQNRLSRTKAEADLLQSCFPGVRHLLFSPLWDAGSTRFFSGCFAWATSPLQIFSTETELSFLVAFGNSVMAEVSRLATIAADQQKGDFIGSISHDLRSPLHGILASAEFLGETECDSFQMSLVDTIDSCGRTLLDTINHVLDFSKINSFERNFSKKSVFRGNSVTSIAKNLQMPQILNICAITDVAAICEEVVEGVYAGQVYQDISSTDISDLHPGARGRMFDRGLATSNRTLLGGMGAQYARKAVDVVLDIEPGDYTFTTQPGALRRVIMNLVTNALKYTEKGVVLVMLGLLDLESGNAADKENGKLLQLVVRDTGKGISSQYLSTRLFTPFAQENSLAPGTGLGLSIVRSITNMLGGSIDVTSEVGQGTEVKIELPLVRVSGTDTPISTPNTSSSLERAQDDSIGVLRREAAGMSVAFYGFDLTSRSPADVSTVDTIKVMKQYVATWYGLEVLPSWPPSRNPDFIIVDEKNLSDLLPKSPLCAVIVICTNTSRHSQPQSEDNGPGIEFLTIPFGPFKLAKTLRICLERNKPTSSLVAPGIESLRTLSIDSPAIEFEALTIASGNKNAPIAAQTTGNITAGDSENALMAVESASIAGSSTTEKDGPSAFPFPKQDEVSELAKKKGFKSRRPSLKQRKTDPAFRKRRWSLSIHSGPTIPNDENAPSSLTKSPAAQTPGKRPPRILVVDDNKINLRLLKTFMAKREYQLVDSADNGRLAVEAVELQADGYDIIFMDISMPVMNGFEATRAIRLIEESRRTSGPDDRPPALIIALTGLASSGDQSEAFTSGVDLFMTKPVSFKEVGRLLDNFLGSADMSTKR